MTGNVQRFVSKLTTSTTVKITDDLIINEPFVLITYTIGFGNVPETTLNFLKKNYAQLKGVAASGNRNWGEFFGRSGKLISGQYKVPLIHTFELSGTDQDLSIFYEGVNQLARDTNYVNA